MSAWLHGCMGIWVYACMGVWVHGCMGMGAWVYGCMGLCAYALQRGTEPPCPITTITVVGHSCRDELLSACVLVCSCVRACVRVYV